MAGLIFVYLDRQSKPTTAPHLSLLRQFLRSPVGRIGDPFHEVHLRRLPTPTRSFIPRLFGRQLLVPHAFVLFTHVQWP